MTYLDGRSILAQLGGAVRHRRQDLSLSLAACGGGLWSHAHLSKVERGLEWPSRDLIIHLEQRLDVPAGEWLAQLARAEGRRWARQGSYYRSGTRQPTRPGARRLPPFYRVGEHGERTPLTIRQVDEIPAGTGCRAIFKSSRNWLTSLDGRVDVEYRWQVEATRDDVSTMEFSRWYPLGITVAEILVKDITGAEFVEVTHYGDGYFSYHLQFAAPLSEGELRDVSFRGATTGIAAPVDSFSIGQNPGQRGEVAVAFVDLVPAHLWWFAESTWNAVPGSWSERRSVRLGPQDSVGYTFKAPTKTRIAGIAWDWSSWHDRRDHPKA